MQSYNTNATSWALANYLYGSGGLYYMVPVGLAIGAGLVIIHRIFVFVSLMQLASCPSYHFHWRSSANALRVPVRP